MKLFRHYFIEDPGQPVENMPELYSLLARIENPTFFYLSASPWELYPKVFKLIRANYPFGQIILRNLQLSSFKGSTADIQAFKEDQMDRIHRWFPDKKFYCIGDSTQADPEAFAMTYALSPK